MLKVMQLTVSFLFIISTTCKNNIVTCSPSVSVSSEVTVQKASKSQLERLKFVLNKRAEKVAADQPMADVSSMPKLNPNARPVLTEFTINNLHNYFQGDIDLTSQQADALADQTQDDDMENKADATVNNNTKKFNAPIRNSTILARQRRKVAKLAYQLWPKPDVNPIPYQFHKDFPQHARDIVDHSIKMWEAHTCVRWHKNGPGIDRLEFWNGSGCSSWIGKTGGVQQISLRVPGCDYYGIAAHEIGHSLGEFRKD